jgi:hypothetical protein
MGNNKIIFLDIDGVLNPVHFMNSLYKMWKASEGEIKSKDVYGDLFFEQNCKALKFIIDNTAAQIVISSTWRMAGLTEMQAMWFDRNLAGKVIDVTPNEIEVVNAGKQKYYDSVCRGAEIALWIEKNNFTGNYVIIDDTEDMLDSQKPFFIVTNGNFGLTQKDALKAVDILNKTQSAI